MFQESLVESSSLLRGRSRWPALVSFGVQGVIAAVVIVLPLMHPELLSMRAPRISVAAPWMKPPVVPERPVRVETSAATGAMNVPAAGTRISTEGFRTRGAEVDRPSMAVGSVDLSGSNVSPLSALGSTGPVGPHVVERPAATAGPVHVSSGVMAGALLEPIHAEYPRIAILSRTQGTVLVQAVISKTRAHG